MCANRIHAIVTFLALLELINLQQMNLIKGDDVNQFWIEENPDTENLKITEHDHSEHQSDVDSPNTD